MSYISLENYMKSKGISFYINSNGNSIPYTSKPRPSYYGGVGYGYSNNTYSPAVGGAIGVRGPIPLFIRISAKD